MNIVLSMSSDNKDSLYTDPIYRHILENMQDGVITITTTGNIITINPEAIKILGLDQENFIDQPFTSIFSKLFADPRNDPFNDAIFSAVFESNIIHSREFKYFSGNVTKDLTLSASALLVDQDNEKVRKGVILVFRDISEQRKLENIQSLFIKHVDPHIVDRLISEHGEDFTKPNWHSMTIGFCDMNSFTNLCETLRPEVMQKLMNIFFSKMSLAVHQNQGVIDKFIGDAIMSFWGEPFTPQKLHAKYGCQTAIDQVNCMNSVNAEINQLYPDEFKHLSINLSIGMSSGDSLVSTIGSDEHQSFTVMGNIVNLASRLVGANKLYGTQILVSQNVVQNAGNDFEFHEIDKILVKGKDKPVTIYELLGHQGCLSDKHKEANQLYAKALSYYRNKQWDKAKAKFQDVLDIKKHDIASQEFLNRIDYLKKQKNLPVDWNGVWELKYK